MIVVTVSVLGNFAIRSLMSIVLALHATISHAVVTHLMVAHVVAFVAHYSHTLVRHRSTVVNLCRSRCGLVHVSIV